MAEIFLALAVHHELVHVVSEAQANVHLTLHRLVLPDRPDSDIGERFLLAAVNHVDDVSQLDDVQHKVEEPQVDREDGFDIGELVLDYELGGLMVVQIGDLARSITIAECANKARVIFDVGVFNLAERLGSRRQTLQILLEIRIDALGASAADAHAIFRNIERVDDSHNAIILIFLRDGFMHPIQELLVPIEFIDRLFEVRDLVFNLGFIAAAPLKAGTVLLDLDLFGGERLVSAGGGRCDVDGQKVRVA
jgi:hypothetical protein